MDEGAPIAYRVLEEGVPVIAADGTRVGSVHHVVAAGDQDIFHGIVVTAGARQRKFVPADEVASLHERGVDLKLDASAFEQLAAPGGGAPEYVEDAAMDRWSHWARRLTGRKDWRER